MTEIIQDIKIEVNEVKPKKQYYKPEYHKARYLEKNERYKTAYQTRKNRINEAFKLLNELNKLII